MRTNDFWQEARRPHFVLPRAPFLDRPASVRPVDFLFGLLMNSIFRQVLGGVKRNDFCAKLIVEALQGHEDDDFVADRFSVFTTCQKDQHFSDFVLGKLDVRSRLGRPGLARPRHRGSQESRPRELLALRIATL